MRIPLVTSYKTALSVDGKTKMPQSCGSSELQLHHACAASESKRVKVERGTKRFACRRIGRSDFV
jgi:hypothetical protein